MTYNELQKEVETVLAKEFEYTFNTTRNRMVAKNRVEELLKELLFQHSFNTSKVEVICNETNNTDISLLEGTLNIDLNIEHRLKLEV